MLIAASAAYADVMHGILQKQWRMDIIGISFAAKGIGMLVLFVLLFHFAGFLPAIVAMALFYIAFVRLYDERFARKYAQIRISFSYKQTLSLLKLCLPLVVCSVLAYIIPAVSRMALERMTDTDTLGIFASATLPANMIQMVVISAFAPCVNAFKQCSVERNYRKYLQVFWVGLLGIVIVFALFYAATLPLGEWLLGLLYGNEMIQYTYLLREAAIVSFLTCLSLFISLSLTVFRKFAIQIIVYSTGVILFGIVLRTMILNFGMSGANYAQIVTYALTFTALLCTSVVISRKRFTNKPKEKSEEIE
jgi:O-antigen/teichoic acid export membrane protein